MTKINLKQFVKNKIEALAFKYLIDKKLTHKKVKNILKKAEYLEPNYHNIKLTDAQLLFQLKTKIVNVKAHYSSSFRENLNCILCEKEGIVKRDTQKHIMKCPVIRKELNYP